ncbi:MAG: flagellar export protein FliJ [Calditrichaeota bacterium]|nr:flagellar export protein FliJ [Calditrichota bacterium]
MKKFKFKLEKLENSKRHFEQKAAFQLAEKIRLQNFEEMKLKQLRKLEHDIIQEMTEKSVFKATEMVVYYTYLNQVRKSKKDQELRLDKAKDETEQARLELTRISQEKKILEKLHEKKFKEYIYAFNQEDQKAIDELATQGKVRKKWQIQAQ